jgi:hypothetical protein
MHEEIIHVPTEHNSMNIIIRDLYICEADHLYRGTQKMMADTEERTKLVFPHLFTVLT